MELAGVAERFHSRTVLITGATGFIAKLLVEKILRLQPGVKRLYLLVRAADQVSANRRVESEEGKKKRRCAGLFKEEIDQEARYARRYKLHVNAAG
uniref:Fatty acyl-CoA reductase n=1 Tax=Oryza glumipatula TaxID=40148 RepID=A0A0E0AIS6_9ORYZ